MKVKGLKKIKITSEKVGIVEAELLEDKNLAHATEGNVP